MWWLIRAWWDVSVGHFVKGVKVTVQPIVSKLSYCTYGSALVSVQTICWLSLPILQLLSPCIIQSNKASKPQKGRSCKSVCMKSLSQMCISYRKATTLYLHDDMRASQSNIHSYSLLFPDISGILQNYPIIHFACNICTTYNNRKTLYTDSLSPAWDTMSEQN